MKDLSNNLIEASVIGDAVLLKTLLDLGADPHVRNSEGMTPLILAAGRGWKECVKILLPVSDCKAKGNGDWSAPIAAASCGKTEVLEMLIRVSDIHTGDSNGVTPLMYAAWHGQRECVRLLLKEGADPKSPDLSGRYPLHFAAMGSDAGCVASLLEAGADPNVKNVSQMTPLKIAAEKGHGEMVRLLMDVTTIKDEYGENSALMFAAMNTNDECLRMLTPVSSVDYQGSWGRTALMEAVIKGRLSCVKTLLEEGANADLRDQEGRSALSHISHYWSSRRDDKRIFELVLGKSDPNLADIDGVTPLMMAATAGNVTAAEALSSLSNLEQKNKKGETVWEMARKKGHRELAEKLESMALSFKEREILEKDSRDHGDKSKRERRKI